MRNLLGWTPFVRLALRLLPVKLLALLRLLPVRLLAVRLLPLRLLARLGLASITLLSASLLSASLLSASISLANPYPLPEGQLKIFAEASWGRSVGAFDENGAIIKVKPAQCLEVDIDKRIDKICARNIYQKQEGKLFMEYGFTPSITLLFNMIGGRKDFFQKDSHFDWFNSFGGARINLTKSGWVNTIEGAFGFQYNQKTQSDIQFKANHGWLAHLAFLSGYDWQWTSHIQNYITSSVGWRFNRIAYERDEFFGSTALGVKIAPELFGFGLIIPNEIFFTTQSDLNAPDHISEYKYQTSLVFFLDDNLAVQLGYRLTFAGTHIAKSQEGLAKIWMIYR